MTDRLTLREVWERVKDRAEVRRDLRTVGRARVWEPFPEFPIQPEPGALPKDQACHTSEFEVRATHPGSSRLHVFGRREGEVGSWILLETIEL